MATFTQRADQVNKSAIATPQANWEHPGGGSASVWTTRTSALSAVGTYIHTTTMPDGSAPGTSGLYVSDSLEPASRLEFRFAVNHATDPNNKVVKARLWLIGATKTGDDTEEVLGEYAGDFTITCGDQALATGSKMLRSTGVSKWADTIAASPDRTYGGAKVLGSIADDGAAVVSVDYRGYRGYVLELTTEGDTAAAATVMHRLV